MPSWAQLQGASRRSCVETPDGWRPECMWGCSPVRTDSGSGAVPDLWSYRPEFRDESMMRNESTSTMCEVNQKQLVLFVHFSNTPVQLRWMQTQLWAKTPTQWVRKPSIPPKRGRQSETRTGKLLSTSLLKGFLMRMASASLHFERQNHCVQGKYEITPFTANTIPPFSCFYNKLTCMLEWNYKLSSDCTWLTLHMLQ